MNFNAGAPIMAIPKIPKVLIWAPFYGRAFMQDYLLAMLAYVTAWVTDLSHHLCRWAWNSRHKLSIFLFSVFSQRFRYWGPRHTSQVCGLEGTQSNEQGEPTPSYRWAGWVWENQGEFEDQDFRKTTDRFRGIYDIYLNLIKKSRKITTRNRLVLEPLRFWPVTGYAQKSPWTFTQRA